MYVLIEENKLISWSIKPQAGYTFVDISNIKELPEYQEIQPSEINTAYATLTQAHLEYEAAIQFQDYLLERGKITQQTRDERVAELVILSNEVDEEYNLIVEA